MRNMIQSCIDVTLSVIEIQFLNANTEIDVNIIGDSWKMNEFFVQRPGQFGKSSSGCRADAICLFNTDFGIDWKCRELFSKSEMIR